MTRFHILILAVLVPLLSGCGQRSTSAEKSDSLARQIGRHCAIRFRGDAMGQAGSNVTPPSAKGTEFEINGVLTALDGEYLIVRQDKGVTWVPQSSILLVRFDESD